MNEAVAHGNDFAPRNFRMHCTSRLGNPCSRLADDLDGFHNRELMDPTRLRLFQGQALEKAHCVTSSEQHVEQIEP